MESALDTILREYIKRELGPSETRIRGRSNENYYIQEIHECLERKGITKELKGFLRQRLVSVLQDKWPELRTPVRVSPTIVQLVLDFLVANKLLFTLSVLVGELGLPNTSQTSFKKLSSSAAETLLKDLGIAADSDLSTNLLKLYTEKQGTSILECIIQISPWTDNHHHDHNQGPSLQFTNGNPILNNTNTIEHLQTKFKQIEQSYNRKSDSNGHHRISIDERLLAIQKSMERDKQIQIEMAVKKFRDDEEAKIRQEMENKMEFQVLAKEKQLLKHFKEKMECLRVSLEQERTIWRSEKDRQERELKEKQRQMDSLVPRALMIRTHSSITNDDDTLAEAKRTIHRLLEENERLRIWRHARRHHHEQMNVEEQSTTSPHLYQDSDRITILHQNLEQQAKEIHELKQFVHTQRSGKNAVGGNYRVQPFAESEILKFLNESKRRCEQIEEEAKSVDRRIKELKKSRMSRLQAPTFVYARPPSQPASETEALLIQLKNKDLLSKVSKPSRAMDMDAGNGGTHQRTVITRRHSDVSPEHSQRNQSIDHPDRTLDNDARPTPSATDQTHDAVARGALSFEKLTSVSEMEDVEEDKSQSHNTNNTTSHRRRISFHDDGEEPVKLMKEDNSLKSLSISGPQHKSITNRSQEQQNNQGGDSGDDVESDFWKL